MSDQLEEIKKKREKMDMFDRSFDVNKIDSEELDWLIAEVERLCGMEEAFFKSAKTIESLTKELKLQEQDNERIIQSSKGAVDRIKAENVELNMSYDLLYDVQQDILKKLAASEKARKAGNEVKEIRIIKTHPQNMFEIHINGIKQ